MPDPSPSSAMREVRAQLARPATWAVLAGIAAIVTLLAPFGSGEGLRPVPRFGFWLVHAAVTYALGLMIHELASAASPARWPFALRVTLPALATGMAVPGAVWAINRTILGPASHPPDPAMLATVAAIAVIVSLLLSLAARQVAPAAQAPDPGPDVPPPLLARLPLERRGPLVALSVEDHYVRVRTARGEAMVLMRLADAMRETGGTPGIQVHRSHWVARDAVAAARREGDRAILTMTAGGDIPVSRRYLPAIREAGLLPAAGGRAS